MQQAQDVYQAAQTLFSSTTDWVVFFREIMGVSGIARRTFTRQEEFEAFQQTPEYQEILQMMTALRKKKPAPGQPREEEGVITVRLPKSMQDALREEARERRTTVNKLCISKLLQSIDQTLIPVEMRDRKPAEPAPAEIAPTEPMAEMPAEQETASV